MRNADEIIKNNVQFMCDWLRLGATLLRTGASSSEKKTLAELLQGKRAVLYRRGKNGYVQVIYGPEVDMDKVKKPGTKIVEDKDGAVQVVKDSKGNGNGGVNYD